MYAFGRLVQGHQSVNEWVHWRLVRHLVTFSFKFFARLFSNSVAVQFVFMKSVSLYLQFVNVDGLQFPEYYLSHLVFLVLFRFLALRKGLFHVMKLTTRNVGSIYRMVFSAPKSDAGL